MKEKITIQDKIEVSQEWVDEIIKKYEDMNQMFSLSMGKFSGNGKKIAKEIKKLSSVGKTMLLMHYKFRQSDFYKKNKNKLDKLEKEHLK
jgi:hypothetical protein